MSYDIEFVYVESGADPLATARRLHSSGELAPNDADDKLRSELVADLLALHPSLQMQPHHRLGFSHGCWIGARDGPCPFPDIEVGIRSAFVPISYANDPEVLRSVAAVCAVFARHGYIAYDPQTDALWSVEEAMSQFSDTRIAATQALAAQGETVIRPGVGKSGRPWWRFW